MPSSRLVLTVLVAGPLACDPGPGADAPADIAAPNALDAEVDLPEAPIDLGEAIEIDLGDLGFTPLSLELGDFDGDGAIDLLITGVDSGAGVGVDAAGDGVVVGGAMSVRPLPGAGLAGAAPPMLHWPSACRPPRSAASAPRCRPARGPSR